MTENELLVAQDQYLKAGIHIGTKFKTKYMEKFIYKTRPDGLSVLNLQKIDERIRDCVRLLSSYSPEDVLVISRRENGWIPVKLFAQLTGVRYFAGRYPPGVITNASLENYIEPKIMLVTDSWPDRNAIQDALVVGIPVISLCDTNNQSNNLDLVIPCNNKGKKSLGLFFYIVARELLKIRGELGQDEELSIPPEDFFGE